MVEHKNKLYNLSIFILGFLIVFFGFSRKIADILGYIAGYVFFVADIYLITAIMQGLVKQGANYSKKKVAVFISVEVWNRYFVFIPCFDSFSA